MNKPVFLIVHHTGGTDADPKRDTSNLSFWEVNEAHRLSDRVNLGHPSRLGYYIGYHYYINKDGVVTQGRADDEEGAHTIGLNSKSLGICLAGNFDVTLPTPAQVEALKKLLREKSLEHGIPIENVVPHRMFASKTCYGDRLADNWAMLVCKISYAEKLAGLLKSLLGLILKTKGR